MSEAGRSERRDGADRTAPRSSGPEGGPGGLSVYATQAHGAVPRRLPLSPGAIGLVGAIYVHFLLFAQFGFLQGIRASGHTSDVVHGVLAAMALAGIVSSFVAAALLRRVGARVVAAVGFLLAAVAGGLAGVYFVDTRVGAGVLGGIAVCTGAGLGAATVATAVLLRRFTGGCRLGLAVGLGTGLAYLLCNIPVVFAASPALKGWVSAGAAAVGGAAALFGSARSGLSPEEPEGRLSMSATVVAATAAFLALVWFDSVVFARVQIAPELRGAFWSGTPRLLVIGVTHGIAAAVAGVMLDRGRMVLTLAIAFLLLVIGYLGFETGGSMGWEAPAYAAGVSLYSTALAAFAALGPGGRTLAPEWRAAWIYAVAGWIGSGAGVGLVEQVARVPLWAAPAAAVVLMGSLAILYRVGAPWLVGGAGGGVSSDRGDPRKYRA